MDKPKHLFSNPEEKLILMITRQAIHKEEDGISDMLRSQGPDLNWDRFIQLIGHHQLVPLAYIALKDKPGLIASDTFELLKKSYLFSLAKNMSLEHEFLDIAGAFNKQDIDFVPLKGMSLLGSIYPDLNYRSMVDIDILVKENTLEPAEKTLLGLGYNKDLGGLKEGYWREKQCHFTFVKKSNFNLPTMVDMHWDLDFKRQKGPILPELWGRLQEQDVQGNKVKFLSWEDTMFSLALHKRRFGNILSLRDACDAACIIAKFGSRIDWDYILEYSRISGMAAPVYFILLEASLLSDNPFISSALMKLNVAPWKKKIISRLILRNIFTDTLDSRSIYLRVHFLLYDSLCEPIKYIINIPQEQFAKFYGLKPYNKKTELFYRFRLFYMFFKRVFDLISKKEIIRRLALIKANFYDKLLGIDTSEGYALEDKSLNKDMCSYQPTFYGRLENITSYLKLTENDIFIDLGCGKGRAVFFVALQRIKKAKGVEIDRELVDIARRNLGNFRKKHSPIEFINEDVSKFKIKDENTFFLFNPFGPRTMEMVINNIKDSLIIYPRRIRIVYYAPAYKDLLSKQDWLFLEGRVCDDNCLVWSNMRKQDESKIELKNTRSII